MMRPILVSILLFIPVVFSYDFYFRYYCHSALWLGVVISFVAVIYVILKSKKEAESLLAILIFASTLRAISILLTRTWGFPGASDSSFNLQLSSLINEKGKLDFGMGFERAADYSYYPALNIWSVMLSQMSALSLPFIARSIFPVLSGSLLLVFYYLSVRSTLARNSALLACLVFSFAPTFIFFDAGYVKESFALISYALLLYIVFHPFRRAFALIGFLTAFVAAFAHHWSSYNLVITLTIIWLFPLVYARILGAFKRTILTVKRFYSLTFPLVTFAMIFSWAMFVALTLSSKQVLFATTFFMRRSAEIFTPSMRLLSYGERVVVYAGYGMLGTFGIVELIRGLIRKTKTSKELVLESWFVFCAVYIFALTFLLPAEYGWVTISQRGWVFAFFGLSPLIAISVARGMEKSHSGRWTKLMTYKPLILVLPLISAVLLAPLGVLEPSVAVRGDSYYITAMWMRQNSPNARIATDIYAWNVLVPYGQLNYYVESSPYTLDLNAFAELAYKKENFNRIHWKTFVFNKEISTWFDVPADSSMFDNHYNRNYDSGKLSLYFAYE